jgi:16S rRNA (cytosine1402-N4)-methyltransferase
MYPREHVPVLREAVLKLLRPAAGETVIDATLGLGGHALSFLEHIGKTGSYVGIDADSENIAIARERLTGWKNVTLHHANFRDLPTLNLSCADIILADLGLSSPHIDDPERGFSFRFDAALDLRFDRTQGIAAAEKIAHASIDELADILRSYGEVPSPGRLARAILESPPATTAALRAVIESVYAWRAKRFMAQVFQALRVWTNDELGALNMLLRSAPRLLKTGGRFAVISYHSLEDRAVKSAFRSLTTAEKDPVTGKIALAAPFTLLTRKPIRPSADEQARNPRSRSALLRAIVRTEAP